MLEHLDALKDAGVDAIKIEDRPKVLNYVSVVAIAYRQVLDGGDPRIWMGELELVSYHP